MVLASDGCLRLSDLLNLGFVMFNSKGIAPRLY